MRKSQKNIPTIVDVARAAGVSTASVSRVLRNSDVISSELHEQVMEAVRSLGYQSKPPRARALRDPWLAVLMSSFTHPFFTNTLAGIQEQAENLGFYPLVVHLPEDEDLHDRVFRRLQKLTLNGVIALGVYRPADEWVEAHEQMKVPMVVFNTEINHPKIATILVNFESAAAQATQHLLNLGHTRIAFLGDDLNRFSAAELRGLKQVLNRQGLDYPEEFNFFVPNTPEGASQGVSRLMMLTPEKRPTAIFAFDDELAIHILNVLRYYGMRVPEDISLVGFDNIPMASHTSPPLTTIDIPQRRIGRQAVSLMDKLSGNHTDSLGYTIIEGSLIVRGSTGPVPLQDSSK